MTLTLFNKMYGHYQDVFDLELSLRLKGITYAEAKANQEREKEWF